LHVVRWLIVAGAAAPLAYYAVAIVCALACFRRPAREVSGFSPPVSVLKPVRGLSRETHRNLASFCRQQYPQYELLFCVDHARDPAVPLIRGLMAEFPDLPIRLWLEAPAAGTNNKVVKLCRLAGEASYDLLVASDDDIRVQPDYLRRVVAPFADPRVGAVTCLYRGLTESSFWSQLEDAALTSNFLPGALLAWTFGLRFALGATMAVRRQALDEIGGFASLADAAADDHALGHRLAARGFRVELARALVETECRSRSLAEYWRHLLRWAVVTRESQPLGHLGFLFAQGLPWTIAVVALAPWRISAGCVAAYLALRFGVAFTVGVWGLGDPVLRRKWWLALAADALGFAVWLASLAARRVVWQGSAYEVRRGRLIPVEKTP